MISIFTVVHEAEINMQALQARSLARFFEAGDIAEIIIAVNDVHEARTLAKLRDVLDNYGPLQSRVRIVTAGAMMALSCRARGPVQHMRAGAMALPTPFGGKYFGGWRGNPGWRVQQALKLLSARAAQSDHILILDAKNLFINPVSKRSFVAPDGRPYWRTIALPEVQKRWARDSFALLDEAPPDLAKPYVPSVTPFCIGRDLLDQVCSVIEARTGPVGPYFVTNTSKTTEFMLIAAAVQHIFGDVWETFCPGLRAPMTIFHSTGSARIREVVEKSRRGESDIFSLHRLKAAQLTVQEKTAIFGLWADKGIVSDAEEAERFIREA